MFPRERRLSRERDIQRVLKTGRRFSTPALLLRCLPNTAGGFRITVVVGTVVSKRAVVRNQIKRQLRHILAAELKNSLKSVDLMVSVKPAIVKLKREERVAALQYLLRQARV